MTKKNRPPRPISSFLFHKKADDMIIDNRESLSIKRIRIQKPIKYEEANIPIYKKWKDKYKIFGFINNPMFGHDRPHCINCNSTLVNESLRESKLKKITSKTSMRKLF